MRRWAPSAHTSEGPGAGLNEGADMAVCPRFCLRVRLASWQSWPVFGDVGGSICELSYPRSFRFCLSENSARVF